MPRVYHNRAAAIAEPPAGPDPEARTALGRPIDPLCFDPADAGLPVKITIMLERERL